MASTITLIAGLGNPGERYAATRHNAGFRFVDAVAAAAGVRLRAERRYRARVGRVTVGASPVWLLEPETFMNLSGTAVAPFARFHHIEPPCILVVHDELDLPAGTVRLKVGGGLGGHNGIRDIAAHLGSADFVRLRVGIGHPGSADQVMDYVLSRASSDEDALIDEAIERARELLPDIVAGEFPRVMNVLNRRPLQSPPPLEAP